MGLELLDRVRQELPGRWVAGDGEFGRGRALRGQLRLRPLRYAPDGACSTLVRDLSERRPPSRPQGKPRRPLFERVGPGVDRQPKGRRRTVAVRGGDKGPSRVKVLLATVPVQDEDGGAGARGRLAVFRSVEDKPRTWYPLSNATAAERAALARAPGSRHRLEELLEQGKQEVGGSHYEVRSWTGGHPPPDAVAAGVGVSPGGKAAPGKKTPAVTASQVRAIFAALLRAPVPREEPIADVINRTLRRSEGARICHGHPATGTFPPRRPRPGRRPARKRRE